MYVYTHIYICTYIYKYTYIHIFIYMHIYSVMNCIHNSMCPFTTDLSGLIEEYPSHTCKHTCARKHTKTHTPADPLIHWLARAQTHIHTHTHTCTHTHTHTQLDAVYESTIALISSGQSTRHVTHIKDPCLGSNEMIALDTTHQSCLFLWVIYRPDTMLHVYVCVYIHLYKHVYIYWLLWTRLQSASREHGKGGGGMCSRRESLQKVATRWRRKRGCDSVPAVPFLSLRSQSPRAQIMSHAKETHRTYECVMPHIRVRHVTHRKESWHAVA